jgi:hypothetical protein
MKKDIKLGNEVHSFSFGLGYIGDMLEFIGLDYVDFSDRVSMNPFKWMPIAMLHSLNYGKEEKWTIEQLMDVLEDDGGVNSASLQEFSNTYILSLTKNVPTQPQDNKKKVKA